MEKLSFRYGLYSNKSSLSEGDIGFAKYPQLVSTIDGETINNGTLVIKLKNSETEPSVEYGLMPTPGLNNLPLVGRGENNSPNYQVLSIAGGGTGATINDLKNKKLLYVSENSVFTSSNHSVNETSLAINGDLLESDTLAVNGTSRLFGHLSFARNLDTGGSTNYIVARGSNAANTALALGVCLDTSAEPTYTNAPAYNKSIIISSASMYPGANTYKSDGSFPVPHQLGTPKYPWKQCYLGASGLTILDTYNHYECGSFSTYDNPTQISGSTERFTTLTLGNSTEKGNSKSRSGRINIYGQSSGYGTIKGPTTNTNLIFTLPSHGDGAFAVWVKNQLSLGKTSPGGAWWEGRDKALLKSNIPTNYSENFMPIFSAKGTAGSWEAGVLYSTSDKFYFVYNTDTGYAEKNTNPERSIYLQPNGKFCARYFSQNGNSVIDISGNKTLTGSLVFKNTPATDDSTKDQFVGTQFIDSTETYSIKVGVGSGRANRGIYNPNASDWMIYADTSNDVFLLGALAHFHPSGLIVGKGSSQSDIANLHMGIDGKAGDISFFSNKDSTGDIGLWSTKHTLNILSVNKDRRITLGDGGNVDLNKYINICGTSTAPGHLAPLAHQGAHLGLNQYRWRSLYMAGNIYLNGKLLLEGNLSYGDDDPSTLTTTLSPVAGQVYFKII